MGARGPKPWRPAPHQETKIRTMHAEGHAASVIARAIQIDPKRMLVVLRRMGLPVSRNSRRSGLTMTQLQEIKKAYLNGVGSKPLGQKYGVNDATITRSLRRMGVKIRPVGFQRGEKHPGWVGGRHTSEDGYIRVWLSADDPFVSMANKHSGANGAGYCLEHRVVLARKLGRPLEEHETVHHIDGDRTNNKLSNLQLRNARHGKGIVLRCRDCGSHNISAKKIATTY